MDTFHSVADLDAPSHPLDLGKLQLARREFLGGASLGLGTAALASLLGSRGSPALAASASGASPGKAAAAGQPAGLPMGPHFPAKAKRVIYLHQAGGPPQMEIFDYKPGLAALRGQLLPDSVRGNQKVTTMTANQPPRLEPAMAPFQRRGQSGCWVSQMFPGMGSIVDEISLIHTMNTEQINHAPAITFLQSGSPIPGRPSLGAWASYGLGSANDNLPSFVVLTSIPAGADCGQPLYEHLWGSGFLPSVHQATKLRPGASPVLFLKNPNGVPTAVRRAMLDSLSAANEARAAQVADPEITARVAQYELAYRMQTSVPELADLSDEPAEVFEMYGPQSRKPGTYAWNCILARRLAERGVRFVQLYHTGWDFHNQIRRQLAIQAKETDQASAALVKDLARRGLLDDTLVVWGGEFGRSVTVQTASGGAGRGINENHSGRDHHGRCFTTWLAGAGVKRGHTHGKTDDFSFNIVEDGVHIHDLQATILERLGFDHERLTYRAQGRDFRLTDIHGHVVKGILA